MTFMNEIKPIIIVILVLITQTNSNLLQPEYSIRIVNTENIILSLGNLDEKNDDLEMIKASPDPIMDKKLTQFHKYVYLLEKERQKVEKLSKKLYHKPMSLTSEFEISSQDLPFTPFFERKRFKIWERRSGKKINNKRKFKKNVSKFFKFSKYKRRRPDIVKRQMPTAFGNIQEGEEYDKLAKDYWDFVNESLANNTAFKYSEEGKPEESVKDVVNKITDVKTPKNCSKATSLGVQAVECVVKNFKDKEIDKKEMLRRISVLILIWIGIYTAFAIPLWCMKGWCCCCFRCEFCLPVTTVREIQRYVAQNPPGVYINDNGEEEHYNPTNKETELYEKLTRLIAEF